MIKTKIKINSNHGLFHDSRGDANKLAKILNKCIDEINKQEKEISELKEQIDVLKNWRGENEL